ncbi:MAG: hypothetical protein Q4B68_04400, partial [Bacteroidales bacterium]|nr:hypothetical protein [Bacteroidales bacterium]
NSMQASELRSNLRARLGDEEQQRKEPRRGSVMVVTQVFGQSPYAQKKDDIVNQSDKASYCAQSVKIVNILSAIFNQPRELP